MNIDSIRSCWWRRTVLCVAFLPIMALASALGAAYGIKEFVGDNWVACRDCWKRRPYDKGVPRGRRV